MGRMHLVGGEKGGVGKSMVAKLLAQFFVDRAIGWAGFDTDRVPGTFARCYGDFVQHVDIGRAAQIDLAVEALESGTEEVVVDLASQSGIDLWRWIDTGQVIEFMDQLRHAVWFWHVIDGSHDSVLLTDGLLDRLAGRARVVCVRNHGRGRHFGLFDEAKLQRRIEREGGVVLDLPELHPDSMYKMDAYDKSFWAAAHNDDPGQGPCLTLMERQRAKVFVRGVHAAFRQMLVEQVPCDA